MKLYYDEEGDFLEISIGKPTKCHAEEIEPGVFIRIDENTKEIKSVGILNFKKRTGKIGEVSVDLPEEIRLIS
nr:DUF2283 domain-containing protein [Candidatus Woesearchaeota archaeon]